MHNRAALALFSLVVLAAAAIPGTVEAQEEDAFSVMQATNFDLKAMWMDIRLESLEFYTVGQGRAGVRVHQQPFRWVDGDERRAGSRGSLSFYLDPSWGEATASGVPRAALEAAVRRAAATWAADSCLARLVLVERKGSFGDVTVTDHFLGTGPFGDPFAADVVFAGWVQGEEPLFRPDTLAVAATYVFVDRDSGLPTDVDGDMHMDVALNEIYFNDAFAWTTGQIAGQIGEAGSVDVETAALHELGHAFALGHFGLPPEAVMNPVYDGPARRLQPLDHAGLCSVWGNGK